MAGEDGAPAKPVSLLVGPLALGAVALAVRAIRRRSPVAGAVALGVLAVEAWYRPYRALLREPRFRNVNLVVVFREAR